MLIAPTDWSDSHLRIFLRMCKPDRSYQSAKSRLTLHDLNYCGSTQDLIIQLPKVPDALDRWLNEEIEATEVYMSAHASEAEQQDVPWDTAPAPAPAPTPPAPVASGVIDYFPDALLEIAKLSKIGNDKHNPGRPMHHARGKSADHPNSMMRHFLKRGLLDPETGLSHTVSVAWRALAMLQEELEKECDLPLPRGAK